MPDSNTLPVGTFCWPELCSGDAATAIHFYTSLFGWGAKQHQMPDGDYTTFKMDGKGVGALYQMKEERKKAGIVPHWNTYVAVANAEETAKRAAELGGKILMQPVDMEGDKLGNLQDPQGAKFCIWQSGPKHEPTAVNEPGALCWTELYTTDPKAASEFYTKLLGWTAKPFIGGPMPYTTFTPAGQERGTAGMLEITAEMKGMSPQWVPYFMVEDADRMAVLVKQLGGQVHCEPTDIPKVGRIVIAADAEGASFAVIKPMPM